MSAPIWIAGNWKMYKTRVEARSLAEAIAEGARKLPFDRSLLVFPSFPSLADVKDALADSRVEVGAQNFHPGREGAFTGEVSVRQLRDCGVSAVLIGHSERRHVFGEPDELLARKLVAAFDEGLRPIFCVGETLEQRDHGRMREVLETQLECGLAETQPRDIDQLLLAYEPVWAIGTGRTATVEQAVEAHRSTRDWLRRRFGSAGSAIPILYGGSVRPENARSLLDGEEVSGLLVGGASLDAGSFLAIAGA